MQKAITRILYDHKNTRLPFMAIYKALMNNDAVCKEDSTGVYSDLYKLTSNEDVRSEYVAKELMTVVKKFKRNKEKRLREGSRSECRSITDTGLVNMTFTLSTDQQGEEKKGDTSLSRDCAQRKSSTNNMVSDTDEHLSNRQRTVTFSIT